MDPDLLMAMLGDISEKLTTVVDLLEKIESNTSSIESDTDDIYYIKSELSELHETIKQVNGIE